MVAVQGADGPTEEGSVPSTGLLSSRLGSCQTARFAGGLERDARVQGQPLGKSEHLLLAAEVGEFPFLCLHGVAHNWQRNCVQALGSEPEKLSPVLMALGIARSANAASMSVLMAKVKQLCSGHSRRSLGEGHPGHDEGAHLGTFMTDVDAYRAKVGVTPDSGAPRVRTLTL